MSASTKRRRLKPDVRAAREVAAALRDRVAAFCQQHGGVPDPSWPARAYNSVHEGVLGGTWRIETPLGVWCVHEPADPSITTLVSINTRFNDPARAVAALATSAYRSRLNPHSGKWNHDWSLDISPSTAKDPAALVSLVDSLMVDFEHATRVFLPTPQPAAPPTAVQGGPYHKGPTACQAIVDDHDHPAVYAPRQRISSPGDKPCSRRAKVTLGKLALCTVHAQLAAEGLVHLSGRVHDRNTIRDVRRVKHLRDGIETWQRGLVAVPIEVKP